MLNSVKLFILIGILKWQTTDWKDRRLIKELYQNRKKNRKINGTQTEWLVQKSSGIFDKTREFTFSIQVNMHTEDKIKGSA